MKFLPLLWFAVNIYVPVASELDEKLFQDQLKTYLDTNEWEEYAQQQPSLTNGAFNREEFASSSPDESSEFVENDIIGAELLDSFAVDAIEDAGEQKDTALFTEGLENGGEKQADPMLVGDVFRKRLSKRQKWATLEGTRQLEQQHRPTQALRVSWWHRGYYPRNDSASAAFHHRPTAIFIGKKKRSISQPDADDFLGSTSVKRGMDGAAKIFSNSIRFDTPAPGSVTWGHPGQRSVGERQRRLGRFLVTMARRLCGGRKQQLSGRLDLGRLRRCLAARARAQTSAPAAPSQRATEKRSGWPKFGKPTFHWSIDTVMQKRVPFNTVVWLSVGCSGVLVSPLHVLTAAHCVHDGRAFTHDVLVAVSDTQILPVTSARVPRAWLLDTAADDRLTHNVAVLTLSARSHLTWFPALGSGGMPVFKPLNTLYFDRASATSLELKRSMCFVEQESDSLMLTRCHSSRDAVGGPAIVYHDGGVRVVGVVNSHLDQPPLTSVTKLTPVNVRAICDMVDYRMSYVCGTRPPTHPGGQSQYVEQKVNWGTADE